MKNIIVTLCAICLPLCATAAINLLSIIHEPGPIKSAFADDLLRCCYMHNPSLLRQANVNVDDIKQINGNTVYLCSVKHESLATEYYLVTINNRHGLVVDGAMLGHDGDSRILAIEHPRGEMQYVPKMELNIDIKDDTVRVLRTYDFFSTMRGGKTFEKHGTICNSLVVNADGKLSTAPITTTATERTGDANYLSKDRKSTVVKQTTGEFFPLGMAVLEMAQSPASKGLDMKALNDKAKVIMQIIESQGENAKENSETMSVVEFARWSFNLGMRHSNVFLTWIARNPKDENFTHFIEACVEDNTNGEHEWLKSNVKNLKDNKARKWWEKWIKENLE